jgi:hypothetical protein
VSCIVVAKGCLWTGLLEEFLVVKFLGESDLSYPKFENPVFACFYIVFCFLSLDLNLSTSSSLSFNSTSLLKEEHLLGSFDGATNLS